MYARLSRPDSLKLTTSNSIQYLVVNYEAISIVQSACTVLEDAVKRLSTPVNIGWNYDLVGPQAPLERTLQLTFAFRLIVNMFMIRGVGGLEMEWAYAWDLHFNGFFVFFSWIYVLQPFLLPLITAQKWISLLLGNTLYFVAWVIPSLVNLR